MAATIKNFVNGVVDLAADDANGFTLENNNLIESAQIGLNNSNNNQTTQAVSNYIAVSDFYIDTNQINNNNYDLVPSSDKIFPPIFNDGMKINFIANFDNDGISPCFIKLPNNQIIPVVKADDSIPLASEINSKDINTVILETKSTVLKAIIINVGTLPQKAYFYSTTKNNAAFIASNYFIDQVSQLPRPSVPISYVIPWEFFTFSLNIKYDIQERSCIIQESGLYEIHCLLDVAHRTTSQSSNDPNLLPTCSGVIRIEIIKNNSETLRFKQLQISRISYNQAILRNNYALNIIAPFNVNDSIKVVWNIVSRSNRAYFAAFNLPPDRNPFGAFNRDFGNSSLSIKKIV